MTAPNTESVGGPLPPTFTEDERLDNERLFGELADLIASGEAVAFVGAGSSMSAGFDGWSGLLEKLATHADHVSAGFVRENASGGRANLDYANRIRDWIVEHGKREAYHKAIAKIFFRAKPFPGLTQFHSDLVRLPFRAFVTSNYDGVIEAAIAKEFPAHGEPQPVPIWNGKGSLLSPAFRAVSTREPIQHVIHVHGYYDIGHSIILCRDDYFQAYGFKDLALPLGFASSPSTSIVGVSAPDPTQLFMLVTALLAMRRLVFVGFSWSDDFFAEVLGRVSDTLWEWEGAVHFSISPTSQETKVKDRILARKNKVELGIDTIFYEVGRGGNAHIERDQLIQRLRGEVDRRVREQSPIAATPLAPVVPVAGTAFAANPASQAWIALANARARKRIEQREN